MTRPATLSLHHALPILFKVRSSDLVPAPLRSTEVGDPFALVTPVPPIVPPDQVIRPLTLIVSVPVRVPLERFTVVVLMVSPLDKFSVPPLTASGPTLFTNTAVAKFPVPPLARVPPVMS